MFPNPIHVIDSWADKDYRAARVLLLQRQIVQGATLASTALEKYLKAVLRYQNITYPKSCHSLSTLYDLNKDSRIHLNKNFLAFLDKSYKLRYPDSLEIGYKLHLSLAKILIELDESVYNIKSFFKLVDPQRPNSNFDNEIAANDPVLTDKNHKYSSISKEEIFKIYNDGFDIVVVEENGGIVEFTLQMHNQTDDKNFDEPTIKFNLVKVKIE